MKAHHHKPKPEADRWLALHLDDAEVGQLSNELSYTEVDPLAVHPTPLLDQVRVAVAAYLSAQVAR
jgi:hypothetical protein